MKKIIFLICFLLIGSFAFAQSYLLIDSGTNEIKSLSPEDDAQLQEGWEKIIIEQDFDAIRLQYHPTYYLYENNKFILNVDKMNEDVEKVQKKLKIAEEDVLIRERMRAMAISELKKEGKEIKYHTDDGKIKEE